MAQETKYEIPAEMREFAEKSMDQAKQAFDTFVAATRHAVGTAETQAKTLQTNAKEAGQLAMSFAERNIASTFDFAQKLARAKHANEILSLHADYVKRQMDALHDQAKEISRRTASRSARDDAA